MPRKLTEAELELLGEPQLAHVATINPDGSPQITPVWIDTDGEAVVFNTAEGRVKHRNLLRDPRVEISLADRTNDVRVMRVKGTAELTTEGADEHIDRLANKYLGVDAYPWRQPGEVRVVVRVTPE